MVSDLWMKIPLNSQITFFFFLSVNLSTFFSDVCGEAEKKKENKKPQTNRKRSIGIQHAASYM